MRYYIFEQTDVRIPDPGGGVIDGYGNVTSIPTNNNANNNNQVSTPPVNNGSQIPDPGGGAHDNGSYNNGNNGSQIPDPGGGAYDDGNPNYRSINDEGGQIPDPGGGAATPIERNPNGNSGGLSGGNADIDYDSYYENIPQGINGIAINYEKPENYNIIKTYDDAEKEFDSY